MPMQQQQAMATDLDWLRDYARKAPGGDLYLSATPDMAARWRTMFQALWNQSGGDLSLVAAQVERQVNELGLAFRLTGEEDERPTPLTPIPVLIGAAEWNVIGQGLIQRVELLERLIADIYGNQSLITQQHVPAALVAGSPHFWRNMIGVTPPKGRHLRFYAADVARGPDGQWRVLADRVRIPVGAGHALQNRLAWARATGGLPSLLNSHRLAPFFSEFRQGLAADCERGDPRIALLTPGRFNQSYAEQAHLARYLGFLLVDGNDLFVTGDQLFVRTIEGLKRIDALWRWIDSRFLDPLAFDTQSAIGAPGLYNACAAGQLLLGNWPGCGVIESRAFAPFLPHLSRLLLGEDLRLPDIATWWCGQPAEQAHVKAEFDRLLLASAFNHDVEGLGADQLLDGATLGVEERERLLRAMEQRPMDYVGQQRVELSTTPAISGGRLKALPFSLRVFLARDSSGQWMVMPGAFARLAEHDGLHASHLGEGTLSADTCVLDDAPPPPASLLPAAGEVRRTTGMLPSRAADNLYWLGRYLERAEMTMRLIRTLLGGGIEYGNELSVDTTIRLLDVLQSWGATSQQHFNATSGAFSALCDLSSTASVKTLLAEANRIGKDLRDRLSPDFLCTLQASFPDCEAATSEAILKCCSLLIGRMSALAGLAAENIARTQAWHFHDMGRRMERGINICRLLGQFASDSARTDDLWVLLDLSDCQMAYRNRYLTWLSLNAVRDMVALEAQNPRSLAFQVRELRQHLTQLPSIGGDGLPEAACRQALSLDSLLAALSGDEIEFGFFLEAEQRLRRLSDSIGQRYFLEQRPQSQWQASLLA